MKSLVKQKRINLLTLFFISILISTIIFYLEEKQYDLSMLLRANEFFNFLFITVLIFLIPFAIHNFTKSIKFSFYLSLLGFLPSIILLLLILI